MTDVLLTRSTLFIVVMNAASGTHDVEADRRKIEAILGEAKQNFRVVAVENPADLGRIATQAAEEAQRENGAVIVAGGDGTINAVAQQVLPTGRPFGIIPQGTFNYSCRAHGIPLDCEEATRVLLSARLKPIQAGLVNDRIFLVNASLGLYPQALQDREAYKRQYGRNRFVALWAAIVTILRGHRPLTLQVEHDDTMEGVRATTLFVGNNPLQLQQVGLNEADAVHRRRLTAVIVRPIGAAGLFWLAVRGALGQLADAKNVREFAFQRMTVEPRGRRVRRRGIKVATDGEVWRARPPLIFSVAEPSLLLMIPASEAAS